MKDAFLITRPWITEKSAMLNEAGKYVFMVKLSATKNEVRKAVEAEYKVKVTGVNMLNTAPKSRRYRGVAREKAGIKKAIVTLKEGDKIDLAR